MNHLLCWRSKQEEEFFLVRSPVLFMQTLGSAELGG